MWWNLKDMKHNNSHEIPSRTQLIGFISENTSSHYVLPKWLSRHVEEELPSLTPSYEELMSEILEKAVSRFSTRNRVNPNLDMR